MVATFINYFINDIINDTLSLSLNIATGGFSLNALLGDPKDVVMLGQCRVMPAFLHGDSNVRGNLSLTLFN